MRNTGYAELFGKTNTPFRLQKQYAVLSRRLDTPHPTGGYAVSGNNVVPLRSDTIRLVQNGCSFYGLRSEDPNQRLKDFLKLVDSLDLDGANRQRTRLCLFHFSHRDQASNWLERLPAGSITTWEDLTAHFLAQFFPPGRTAKLRNDILIGPHDTQYCMEDPEQAFVKYASSRIDEAGEGLVSSFMASQDARLSKFEANFKQQQSEMTNKINTVLKAITDRIAGALPSDTVKNPKLSTYPVLSARSYPTEDPQCLTHTHGLINAVTIYPKQQSDSHDDRTKENKEEEKDNLENICVDHSTQPNPSISFINEKVLKLNSFFESLGLVPQSSNTELVCTKGDDDDVMFIEIVQKNDDSHKEEPEAEEQEVEYFDIFPTRSELACHMYLMCGLIPSIFLRNPIIMEGCPSNLKIPCNIGHVHVEKAYIDPNSPLNIMTRMMYNWIMRRKLDPKENSNRGVSNFTRRIKGMHVVVRNFTYVIEFMFVEDISSIIDP
ncbi:MAK10-like protein [Tanacetum coccineum]